MSGTFDIQPFIGGFHRRPLLLLADPLPARPRRPAWSSCGSASSTSPPAPGAWENVGESWRRGRPCSGPKESRTGSTTGVPSTSTTGRRGGRCFRPTSSRPCDQDLMTTPRSRQPSAGRDAARPGRPRAARGDPVGRQRRTRAPGGMLEGGRRGRQAVHRASVDAGASGHRDRRRQPRGRRSSARAGRRADRPALLPTTTYSRPVSSPRGAPRRGSSPSGTGAGSAGVQPTARGTSSCC